MNSSKKSWAGLLFFLGVLSYYFPHFNGLFSAPSLDVTSGDARIVSAIYIVGALLLWYLPSENK